MPLQYIDSHVAVGREVQINVDDGTLESTPRSVAMKVNSQVDLVDFDHPDARPEGDELVLTARDQERLFGEIEEDEEEKGNAKVTI